MAPVIAAHRWEIVVKDAEIERLRELIAKAGPLHWVMHEDIEGAREWEIEARRALEANDV
jgi:hypothetical protein